MQNQARNYAIILSFFFCVVLTVPTCQPNVQKSEPTSSPQTSNTSSTLSPSLTFVPGKSSSVNTFQSSSKSSPVSVTVSPSLKTPSFLGQSGTYSFRICPPAKQDCGGQNPPGVTLPGGFTLIQLPKHRAYEAPLQSENTTNTAGGDKALPPKGTSFNSGRLLGDPDTNWLGLDTFMRAKELLSSGPIKPGTAGNNKASSGERNEADISQDSNQDITSEDLSSESSDCCIDGDEEVCVRTSKLVFLKESCLLTITFLHLKQTDVSTSALSYFLQDEFVDIETVEEAAKRARVNKMDDAEALRNSR